MKIKKVLVSQPRPEQAQSPYLRMADKLGLEMVFRPFIQVEGLTAYEFRKQKIDFAKFPSIVFTTRTAVDHFFRIAEEIRYTVPETTRYFCTSEQVALYLQKYTIYRKRKIFFPEDGELKTLIKSMQRFKTERFLIPLSDVHKADIPRDIRKEGIRLTKVILYRTVSSPLQDLDINTFDALVFYSPQGIKSLQENFPSFEQGDKVIAAFGKSTHNAVKRAGYTLQVAVPTAACKSMTEALEHFIAENNTKKK